MPKTKDRVAGMAGNARPYVERAIRDEELREHVRQAYAAARDIYDEFVGPRGVTEIASRVAKDEEVQDNLRTAIAELRQAANRLHGRRQSHGGRTFLLFLGVIVGLFYNPVTGPSLRGWVKNRLFGGDEFGFDSGSSGDGSGSGA